MGNIYSNSKIFNFSRKLKSIADGKLTAPIHVRLKPTNRCNHNCCYCCYRNKALYLSQLFYKSDEIPWAKMKEIIEDLGYMGVKAVTLSGGGEPLFYPYIFKTIDSLTSIGIKVAVLTNGSLLNGKVAEILSKKAIWVRISMDAADSKKYSKIRNVNVLEFDRVCKNISNFVQKKDRKCELGVNFIVMKENHQDVYRFLNLMKDMGVSHVKVSEAVRSVNVEKNKQYYLSIIEKVKVQLKRGISELCDEKFSIIDKVEHFDKTDDAYNKEYDWCPFIQCLTVIAADMNVYACQDKAYTKKGYLGSINQKRFKDFWFSYENKTKMSDLEPRIDCNHHCTQHDKNLMLLDYFGLDKNHLEFV
jgi:MoaA/NifB/PqqE/SkfB family radical SAM enzyme